MTINEIVKYAEEVHAHFPQISVVEIVKIWLEQRNMPFSETECVNTNLTNICSCVMVDFIFKVYKKFLELSLLVVLIIWTNKECKPETCLKNLETNTQGTESDFKSKTCQHMYIKVRRANTQCTIKVKGEDGYCSKHKLK